jgi:hypothetical protein
MNGMYEMVFPDPARPMRVSALLASIGSPNVGRIRDAWVEKGERGPVIAIYTRNGRGNRIHDGAGPAGMECDCTGCIARLQLPAHSQYIRDADDTFDATYATFYFKPPESPAVLEALTKIAIDPVDMSVRWQAALAKFNPGAEEATEMMRQLLGATEEA